MSTKWRMLTNWKRGISRVGPTAAVLLAAGLWLAAGREARAAGLLISDGGLGGTLDIDEHTVRVTINNGIAVTEVTQVFHNTENRQVEALYLFPVPKGASVANFSMWIGGKEMIGEVVEKQRARQIYDSYKRIRRDPGLLEQVDYKNFEMRIFPIAAGAQQKVQITYYQELDFDHDWATYVYPLATAPRPGLGARTKGKFGLSLHVKSEVPIVGLESPSHKEQFVVVKHADNYREASLETTGGDLNRDLVLAYHVSRPHTGIDVITSKPAAEDGYFLLTMTPGKELEAAQHGMDYVFLLDISGSMRDDSKLALSRDSIDAFIRELGTDDRFELITFNVAPEALFKELRAVNKESLAKAVEFLRAQQARGGTVLRPAMAAAYRYGNPDRPLNVVILSDGLTEQSEQSELLNLIQSRPRNARVFCIGVGNDVNRPLLSQIAQQAGGLAAFLSREDNFERQAKAFRRKLLHPAASNVQIALEGADAYDVEPRQLPNLYHGMPLRMYGRYRTTGPAKVRVKAEINGAAFDQTLSVQLAAHEAANPEIERMWAWQKIDRLLKEAALTGSRAPAIDEVVRLGEGYSIVTEYTSFIVLENDAEYQRWKIDRRNLVRLGRDRRQQEALQAELTRARERSLANLVPHSSDEDRLASAETIPSTPRPVSLPSSARRDLDFGSPAPSSGTGHGGGGGAFDPISGTIALAMAGLGFAAQRRRKSSKRE
ncbi:MAG TPA: VIT domain-containing protein [Planctomycetaceae bacterium]|nr:VIT domain-containing protein [Planctomycetaceae bacterium]